MVLLTKPKSGIIYIHDVYMIIYKISSPYLQFCKVDEQGFLFFPFSGTCDCQSALFWFVLGLSCEFLDFWTYKLHYLVEVVLEPVLEFLVVAATLIRSPLPECFGEAVKYCGLSPCNFVLEIPFVGPEEVEVDFVFFEPPAASGDPAHVYG